MSPAPDLVMVGPLVLLRALSHLGTTSPALDFTQLGSVLPLHAVGCLGSSLPTPGLACAGFFFSLPVLDVACLAPAILARSFSQFGVVIPILDHGHLNLPPLLRSHAWFEVSLSVLGLSRPGFVSPLLVIDLTQLGVSPATRSIT